MRRRQGALTQLAADFGSAPLVVVTAADRAAGGRAERCTFRLTATPPKSAKRSRHRYLGSTESRRPAHGAAPVGVTGARPGYCVTTTTPCVDGTAAGWAARSCTVTELMLPWWWCPPPLAVRTAPAPSALCRVSFTNPFTTSVQRRSRREDSRSKYFKQPASLPNSPWS